MTAFFDCDGKQVPELQLPWLDLYIEFLVENGIDPCKVLFSMPDSSQLVVREEKGIYYWSDK
jgi:hypothetical protein